MSIFRFGEKNSNAYYDREVGNREGNLFENFSSWTTQIKRAGSLLEIFGNTIQFELDDKSYYLVPITSLDLSSPTSISQLMSWRSSAQFAFPSRFKVSHEGTYRWLDVAVLQNPNRALFWIVASDLSKLGHIGLQLNLNELTIEIDNVYKLESGPKGLMAKAVIRLEQIVEEEFSLEKISLKVLESNIRAVDFYKKLDYKVVHVTSLVEVKNGETLNLVPGTPAVDNFLTMSKSLMATAFIPSEILTAGPSISNREINYVRDAVTNGWNYQHSDYITRFENSFAEYIGSKYAMATSSCSGALHLALLALGIGPGDEVIVPDVTWVATASAVMYTGAKPVFADINVDDWTINPDSIKSLINKKTKAIMPVHLYGYGANMARIMEISLVNNLHVVEDAAPAIGTEIDMKRAGTFGDFGCFSFQGAKLLVTGEGGMLVTDDEDLYKRAKKIQDHGRKPGTFWIDEIGHKYKMSNVTAALGLAQIERAENLIFRKRRMNRWYTDSLSDIESITFQSESPGTRSICWMNSFTLKDDLIISRDELISSLKKDGIDSRPVFPAISQYPIWKYDATIQPNANKIGATGINLPSGVLLSQSAIEKVCMSIRKAILS